MIKLIKKYFEHTKSPSFWVGWFTVITVAIIHNIIMVFLE